MDLVFEEDSDDAFVLFRVLDEYLPAHNFKRPSKVAAHFTSLALVKDSTPGCFRTTQHRILNTAGPAGA